MKLFISYTIFAFQIHKIQNKFTLQGSKRSLTKDTNSKIAQQGNNEEKAAEDVCAAPERREKKVVFILVFIDRKSAIRCLPVLDRSFKVWVELSRLA